MAKLAVNEHPISHEPVATYTSVLPFLYRQYNYKTLLNLRSQEDLVDQKAQTAFVQAEHVLL